MSEVEELSTNLENLTIDDKKENKQKIIDLFIKNIKGKEIRTDKKHCGSQGHWLEKQFK